MPAAVREVGSKPASASSRSQGSGSPVSPSTPTTGAAPTTNVAPTAPCLSGRGRRGQCKSGYADYAGNLRPDRSYGVGQDDRRHSQATNQEGSQPRPNSARHGLPRIQEAAAQAPFTEAVSTCTMNCSAMRATGQLCRLRLRLPASAGGRPEPPDVSPMQEIPWQNSTSMFLESMLTTMM